MTDSNETEVKRLIEQTRLDGLKGTAERNEWGQFATPPTLADEILRFASNLTGRVRFLDPAVGTGSFFSALLKVFGPERVAGARGMELDPAFALAARRLWASAGLEVIEADFTALQPQACCDLLVCNPPYVRHHHLDPGNKERLQHRVLLEHRIRISGLAGLYCYFLLLSDAWMDNDGLAIWLIPSEFMDVNYGHAVKQYLADRVQLLHIHRFCPADVQFTDALVSSAVVVFRKRRPAEDSEVRMSLGGSLLAPNRSSMVSIGALRGARKWTAFPALEATPHSPHPSVTLGDLFAIKRGIATGANGFFILSEEKAERYGIPEEFRRPILPNPRQLSAEVVETDRKGYPSNTTRLALIDCHLPEHEVEDRFPRFWQYLQTGKAAEIHTSYLTSRRSPWYSQERRDPAPFLFTYMGRSVEGRKPFRVIWNRSAAIAHNVYLLLYPKGALKRILDDNPDLYQKVFEHLRSLDGDRLMGEGRVYGGGLYKLEPKELARVSAESLWERVVGTSVPPVTARPEQLRLGW
jgi:hypothetical protein